MAGSVCPTHATKIAITVRLEIVIADQPAREADQDRREAARSPFSAPSASVISASSTSCSAVRTSARRNSSSSLRRALTSIVPDLPCLLVMVCILAKGSGDCDITRIHDHPPQRLLQNFPDTTLFRRQIHVPLRSGWGPDSVPKHRSRGPDGIGGLL